MSASGRRRAWAAVVALCFGLAAVALLDGLSSSYPIRLVEVLGLVGAAVVVLGGVAALLTGRLARWTDPASEAEFEVVVARAERLAAEGLAAEPDEGEFSELDPWSDADFEALVREALDDLPDLLVRALRNVAVVIRDDGRKRAAYGLYVGDGVARDDVPDRVVIFRDTLRRDFGADPDALRDQVTRTVRHELAHHVGFDELGVRELGL